MKAHDLNPGNGDLLVLCGGDTWNEGRHAAIIDIARQRLAAGKPVAAICAATVALARAGCLDAVAHTSNDLGQLMELAPNYCGKVHYRQQPAVRAGTLVTAPGSAPIPFTAETLLMVGAMTPELAEAWTTLMTTYETEAFQRFFNLWQASAPG